MSSSVAVSGSPAVQKPAIADALPMVSVIIPVKNDARRLQMCLESLSSQDYPSNRYEIIVVDNGSQDDSPDVARQGGATLFVRPELFVGALRNLGVAESTGSVLAFIDADHEAPSSWLSDGVAALQGDKTISIVGSHYLPPPRGTWVQRYWAVHRLRRPTRHVAEWLGAGNMFVWRDDFKRAGGYSEDLVAAEDVDLCSRVRQNGRLVVNDPSVANIHHGEPATLLQFFRKECWRGSSGVRAFFKQGFPLRELPSLLYPAYYLFVILSLMLTAATVIWHRSLMWLWLCIFALLLPALLLATITTWQSGNLRAFLPLTSLYVTYGLARAAALFKR